MVFVAFITSGSLTSGFETIMCGVFHNLDDAAKSLLKALIEEDHVFDYRDDDEECKEAYDEAQLKLENGTFTISDLEDYVDNWNDTYLEEKWNYTISEVRIQ